MTCKVRISWQNRNRLWFQNISIKRINQKRLSLHWKNFSYAFMVLWRREEAVFNANQRHQIENIFTNAFAGKTISFNRNIITNMNHMNKLSYLEKFSLWRRNTCKYDRISIALHLEGVIVCINHVEFCVN